MARYIAIDLGAESGRVILGSLQKGKLRLRELHRFSNQPVQIRGTMRWDVLQLWAEIQIGLHAASRIGDITSIACDSWGVDYVLLKGDQPLLELPYTYRDERTFAAFDNVLKKISHKELFAQTGIGSYPINTLFQLCDDVRHRPKLLRKADRILLIADYINWMLTGKSKAETTLASTSQCWNTRTQSWAWPLLKKLRIPKHLFPKTIQPGTVIGNILPQVSDNTGLVHQTKVVATCSHDTAAAVAAIPATGKNWAYLSSGTWSLLGVELHRPLVNEKIRAANFTNEAGFAGTTRLLKCLVGLWILQECRRDWSRVQSDYATIVKLARAAKPLRSLIQPADIRFAKVGGMTKKVQAYCRETNQPVPQTHGEIARCIFESLALSYRLELDGLQSLIGRKISTLHVVGGGCQNALLNQMTADALGRRVIAGPVEATAAGNILVQAAAMKEISGIAAIRSVMRRSFALKSYTPSTSQTSVEMWRNALDRFQNLPIVAPSSSTTIGRTRQTKK
ncbi:MAG: rhamnulokinase [Planctomycetota bacterium]|nr:rhamnulokinase [Planctomycetota bacterium]